MDREWGEPGKGEESRGDGREKALEEECAEHGRRPGTRRGGGCARRPGRKRGGRFPQPSSGSQPPPWLGQSRNRRCQAGEVLVLGGEGGPGVLP